MATVTAFPISLKVLPIQSVDLCFEVPGVIQEQNLILAQRGTRITAFDLKSFYANLLVSKGDVTRPGLLKFDSATIYSSFTSSTSGGPLLFSLRAENVKALLDKAIATRENSYYKKFVNQATVINIIKQFYTPSSPTPAAPLATKPDHLEKLATIAQTQHDELNLALNADPTMSGVVKATTSDMIEFPNGITYTGNITLGSSSVTNLSSVAYLTIGTIVSNSNIPAGTTITAVNADTNTVVLSQNASATLSNVVLTMSNKINTNTSNYNDIPPGNKTSHSNTNPVSGSTPPATTSTTINDLPVNTSASPSQGLTTHSNSVGDPTIQHTVTKGYTFRVPTAENDAQNERAQASLIDERFKAFMRSQHLPFLNTVFANDLSIIDLDVKRLQVSFINSLLVSPVSGVVTQIYRHVGDCVQAGQPIMRVDQDDVILVAGTVKCRSLLQVGMAVQISTNLYDANPMVAGPPGGPPFIPPTPTVVAGSIVIVRGNRQEDERWDIVIQCNNPFTSAGNPTIPLNYSFDFDDTLISVTI